MIQSNSKASASAVAVAGGIILLVAILLRCEPSSTMPCADHLSAQEARHVQQLARRIVHLQRRGQSTPEKSQLREAVRTLSIREASGLGEMLLNAGHVDVVEWIRCPAERERQVVELLNLMRTRIAPYGPWDSPLETTVRGSSRLRAICGVELLTEITGVKLRHFDDDVGGSKPIELDDDDLEVLLELPGLEEIWIDCAQITDAGVARLARLPRLREVHLVQCDRLTGESVHSIGRPQLQHLDVARCSGISDAGVEGLSRCPNLKVLVLDNTKITSAVLPVIANCRQLTELSLNGTAVRAGLEQLRSLRFLERLGLSHLGSDALPVPSESLIFLSDCKRLTSLDLEQTAVRRVELRHLPQLAQFLVGHLHQRELVLVDLPRLQEFRFASDWSPAGDQNRLEHVELSGLTGLYDLWLRGLTAPASDGLAHGLADLTHLRIVSLSSSVMTDGLANAIGRLPQLERLDLSAAKVTSKQRQAILSAPQLQFLRCGGQGFTADDWNAFCRSSLKGLEITGLVLSDMTKPIPWATVEQLTLYDCRIQRLVLNSLPALKSIDIRNGDINELIVAGCSQLTRYSQLEGTIPSLRIESCPRLESFFVGFEATMGVITLNDLSQLGSVTIQERSSVRELKLSGLPRVKSVSFWLANVSPGALTALNDLPALARLDISNTKLGDDSAVVVGGLAGLEHLSASPQFTRHGLEQLRSLPRLRSLNLYRSQRHADWSKEDAALMWPNVRPTVFDIE